MLKLIYKFVYINSLSEKTVLQNNFKCILRDSCQRKMHVRVKSTLMWNAHMFESNATKLMLNAYTLESNRSTLVLNSRSLVVNTDVGICRSLKYKAHNMYVVFEGYVKRPSNVHPRRHFFKCDCQARIRRLFPHRLNKHVCFVFSLF